MYVQTGLIRDFISILFLYWKKKKIKKITQAREGRYPVRLAVAISEGDFHRI